MNKFPTKNRYSTKNHIEIRQNASLKSKIQRFISLIWIFAIPLAYEKKEKWIAKSLEWEPVIDAVFKLFLKYENYGVVCRAVNKAFRDFLKKPLTHQQIKHILSNPVYIGKPKFGGAVVADSNLRYVDDELFAKAQEIIATKNLQRHKKIISTKNATLFL